MFFFLKSRVLKFLETSIQYYLLTNCCRGGGWFEMQQRPWVFEEIESLGVQERRVPMQRKTRTQHGQAAMSAWYSLLALVFAVVSLEKSYSNQCFRTFIFTFIILQVGFIYKGRLINVRKTKIILNNNQTKFVNEVLHDIRLKNERPYYLLFMTL